MGFFSRFKPGFAYTAFQRDVFMPAIKEALTLLGNAERFEHFSYVWRKVLTEAGKPFLADAGDHVVKYYCFVNVQEGGEMLEAHLAAFIIPDFSELPAFKKFEGTLAALIEAEKRDDGLSFDAAFRQFNPKSADMLKKKYGFTPFSKELREEYMKIAAGRY